MGESKRHCPLDRITVYWCDSMMGIHYDNNQGEWNGHRKHPESYVRADLYDALIAERNRLATDLGVRVGLLEQVADGLVAPTRDAIQARHDAMYEELRKK